VMSEQRRAPAFPDFDQTVAFHEALMQRLGLESEGVTNEARLRGTLDRARQVAQGGRGDIVTMAAFLVFGLIKDEPFGKYSVQTGLALTLAFLLRNGVPLMVEQEELAGLGLGIAQGEVFAGMIEMWMRECIRGGRW
jgi:prophage maintenance system killer protein